MPRAAITMLGSVKTFNATYSIALPVKLKSMLPKNSANRAMAYLRRTAWVVKEQQLYKQLGLMQLLDQRGSHACIGTCCQAKGTG